MTEATAPDGPRRGTRRRSAQRGGVPSRGALALLILLSAGLAGMFLLLWLGSHALAGVRGYLQGEALYARAHKDAVLALQRFASTGEPRYWERYTREIAVPLAYSRARQLMVQGESNPRVVRAALVEGHDQTEDLATMMLLFRWRSSLPRIAESIEIWAAADALVRQLDSNAHLLRLRVLAAGASKSETLAVLLEIERLDAALSGLESAFSQVMGRGAREKASFVLGFSSVGAVLLLTGGMVVSARLVRRIRRREDRFRSIIEHTSDLVTILDAEGEILYQSPSVERMLGYRFEELVGDNAFAWVHPDDLPKVRAEFSEFLADVGAIRKAEFRFRHADGSWRILSATGSSYMKEDGTRRILVNSRDITLQRELERELGRAGRMESVGRLAGGVAHDFNNLLTAILGAAEAMRASLPEHSPARAEIAEVVGAAERAADLTRQLLTFARRQVVEPVVFDLREVVHEMEAILRRLLTEKIELSIEVPEFPLHIHADRTQIEQVIVNLAANARDAMPDGGRLRIRVTRRFLDRETAALEAGGYRGPYVMLEVEDTGVAMDPAVMERIFEPFFSTKEAARGAGLGLATTYGIVRQNGGYVTVTSERGRGSCFRVHLRESRAPKSPRPSARTPAPVVGSETVLLVEDQPEVRRVAARVLRARGYQVIEMTDGEQALHWAGENPTDFDLVVTDVVMPRLGGPALAERLRKRKPDLPIVFISGYPDDEKVLEAADARTALVQKPFSPNVLAGRVRALLDERRTARSC